MYRTNSQDNWLNFSKEANLQNSRFVFFHAFVKFGHPYTLPQFTEKLFLLLSRFKGTKRKPAIVLMIYDLTDEYIVQIGLFELASPSSVFGN